MSFQAVVPIGGYSGWKFLSRTLESQRAAFAEAPQQVNDREYFLANIRDAQSAEALTTDFRLLRVALGAFGLEDDLQNKFFIQRVLEDGTASPDALSHKLTDKRYRALSEAFGFGEKTPPRTGEPGFADEILSAYAERQFEVSVGEKNEEFRLALNAERELAEVASGELSNDGKWYAVMGSTPLRSVFETAFGLPDSFSRLDLDDQLGIFRAKAAQYLGNGEISQFSEPERIEGLVRKFLLHAEMKNLPSGLSSGVIALQLLGGVTAQG